MGDADAVHAEQVFFADPALDRMFGVLFRLATELQLMRAKVQRMEAVLDRQGMLDAATPGPPDGDEAELAASREDRMAYVEHILSPLLGRAASRGAP